MSTNNHVFMIVGGVSQGKSYSLKFMDDPSKLVLLNGDIKKTPFKNKFTIDLDINDPLDVLDYIDQCEENSGIETVAIDTITYLMRRLEVCISMTQQTQEQVGWLMVSSLLS